VRNKFLIASLSVLVFTLNSLLAQSTNSSSTTTNLVYFQRGDLPILLTAPHGGTNVLKDVLTRTNGTILRDDGTYELALLVSEELTKLTKGKKPYLVAAQFHRKFLDVNRPATNAFESTAAQPYYETYHQQVSNYVAEIRQRFGGEGLMIDLHGQARDAASIFRGTGNGVTVLRLIQKQGESAFTGTNSILGQLAAKGYSVVPNNTPPGKPPEDRSYNGGFTVRTYGSSNDNGIDAIQLELGSQLRRADRKKFARDLAQAIFTFQQQYLKETVASQKASP
jgi:N-formylglutamate amidohydrolase